MKWWLLLALLTTGCEPEVVYQCPREFERTERCLEQLESLTAATEAFTAAVLDNCATPALPARIRWVEERRNR